MLDCLVKVMQKVSKSFKLEWFSRKMIIIISNKKIIQNIPKCHEKSCGHNYYVK